MGVCRMVVHGLVSEKGMNGWAGRCEFGQRRWKKKMDEESQKSKRMGVGLGGTLESLVK